MKLLFLVSLCFAGGLKSMIIDSKLKQASTTGDMPSPGAGVFTLFYSAYSSWSTAYIYYNADNQGWVTSPGLAMVSSTNSSYPGPTWRYVSLYANSIIFVFTNGQGQWTHASGGANFVANSPGVYVISQPDGGSLKTLATYAKACPGPDCSGNGVCNQQTYTCTCNSGYWGDGCAGICPGGVNNVCNGNGKCNNDGTCTCTAPWSSCGSNPALDCTVNTAKDINNCGKCGNVCETNQTGTQSASCVNSNCVFTCDPGYIACPTGCTQGDYCPKPPLPGCQTFSFNQCVGNNIITPPQFEASRWWTPHPGDSGYQPSYQSYYTLVGHASIVYNAARTSANVTLNAIHSNVTSVTFKYYFNGTGQAVAWKIFDTSFDTILYCNVTTSDGAWLNLDPIDLLWNAPAIPTRQGDYRDGQKGAIVEMFGWPHAEIEAECAAVAKMGYLGVKVFPAQEQVMSQQPFQNVLNPWYFMYQPVSYRLQGRMGTRDELRSLIYTCRSLGVRVYADAVINHMVGGGNDANPSHRYDSGACTYWPNKNSSAASMSPFYTQDFAYTYNQHTGQPPCQEFPAVPYGPTDFHCERALNSWTDPLDLNAGWLDGLVDLNTELENVQRRIADYMTDLISLGFSGFRIDAAKHIRPDDHVAIFTYFKENMGGTLPDDFITWWEILLGGEADMLMCNENSGYNYGAYLTAAFQTAGFSEDDLNKIKIWNSGYPKEPDATCDDSGAITKWREAIQNDDADQQNPGSTSRDMGDQGCVLIKDCSSIDEHRGFEVKLFQDPNGADDNANDYPIRMVLSSYYWASNGSEGVPDGKSDCSQCQYTCTGCQTFAFSQAYDPNSCGYDNPVYTRPHRDRTIIMAMRQWMDLPTNVPNSDIGLPDNCT